jgi:hypothetical protein
MSSSPLLSSNAPSSNAPSEAAPAGEERRAPSLVDAVLAAPEVTQTFAVVEEIDGAELVVRAGGDAHRARRSKGCLVEPARGDVVLLARSEHHGAYVLSVLESPDDQGKSVVSVDGDLTLRSKSGKVAVVGTDGVSVTSGREVSVDAPEIVASAMKATVFADSLSYLGRQLDAQVERVRAVGHAIESAFDVLTSKVKHSYRTIEETEHVKAKEMHVRASATLNMHGKNSLVTAEKLVKLDGEQIHLG